MRRIVLALTLMVAVFGQPAAAAENALDLLDAKVDYEADYYLTIPEGTYRGKVHHSRGLERREFGTTGGTQILILNRREGTAAMLTPRVKMWTSLSLQAVDKMFGGVMDMAVERVKDGPEIVKGESTERYNVTATSPSSGGSYKGQMWFTKEGVLMKAAGTVTWDGKETPFETGLSDLRLTRQDASHFEKPKDFWGFKLQDPRNPAFASGR